ncbi:MAG: cyclic nucleotide-binding domain-containing protein [Nitrospinae bacterium]|nr:cyclic nucleotide-binding domain-containing protein [Nitrospinota bacterium]
MHVLAPVKLFEDLSDQELSALHHLAFPIKVEKDDYVFREDSLGRQIYVILEGRVEILIERPAYQKEPLTLAVLETNEIFGEFSLFDDYARSASAVAAEPSHLLEFHKTDLLEFFEKNNRIGMIVMRNLGKILCERLRQTDTQIKGAVW